MSSTRKTKYSEEILKIISEYGHATNSKIHTKLKKTSPDVSATTVHRVTARLLERGLIGEAPTGNEGCMRFDSNTTPHDHFLCNGCDGIRDLNIADEFIPRINESLGGCKVTGRLVIHGTCNNCLER